MLAIKTIKEKESNDKWQKLIQLFYKRSQEIQDKDNRKLLNNLYEKIILDIYKIEKIDDILISDNIESFPDEKEKLILEKDELKIEASFKFLGYLVAQETIQSEQIINSFLIGIDCINTTLMNSGETLYSLGNQKILFFIQNLHKVLDIWKNIKQTIENKSIWLVHENSLKLIYCSLYILEDTYRYLVNNKQNNYDENIDWEKEDKLYENLLEDLDEWSNENWSEEEQKAFERAMSNLS